MLHALAFGIRAFVGRVGLKASGKLNFQLAGQSVGAAFIVALRRADIAPVAVARNAEQLLALIQKTRKQILCKVKFLVFGNMLHCTRRDDVYAGVNEVCHNMPPVGLFNERADEALAVAQRKAVAQRLRLRAQSYRRGRGAPLVLGNEL